MWRREEGRKGEEEEGRGEREEGGERREGSLGAFLAGTGECSPKTPSSGNGPVVPLILSRGRSEQEIQNNLKVFSVFFGIPASTYPHHPRPPVVTQIPSPTWRYCFRGKSGGEGLLLDQSGPVGRLPATQHVSELLMDSCQSQWRRVWKYHPHGNRYRQKNCLAK